jgi:hypothetical protein
MSRIVMVIKPCLHIENSETYTLAVNAALLYSFLVYRKSSVQARTAWWRKEHGTTLASCARLILSQADGFTKRAAPCVGWNDPVIRLDITIADTDWLAPCRRQTASVRRNMNGTSMTNCGRRRQRFTKRYFCHFTAMINDSLKSSQFLTRSHRLTNQLTK